MAEAKAAAVASTLLSFGGPAGALLGGVVGGLLGKEKIPDTVPLEYATTAADLDPKDFKYYVQAQISSGQRQAQAMTEQLARQREASAANARAIVYESNLKMAQAQLDMERQSAQSQMEAQQRADQAREAELAKSRRTTSQQTPSYSHVDVTEQLIPVLTNQALTAIPAAPVVAPSNVAAPATVSKAGISSYLPMVIGGALILSLILTGRKGKS